MQTTAPHGKDSLLMDNLDNKDGIFPDISKDSVQVHDLDFFGPWHKQNTSLQHQIALIKKAYTSSNHQMPHDIAERAETQIPQGRLSSQQRSRIKPTRMLSIDQVDQFIEKPKYDQSRQVQKIITEFFTEDKKQRKKKSRNYGFFVPNTRISNSSKSNIQSFQTTQMYFDKIANKMLNAMPVTQTSFQKYYKSPALFKNSQRITLDLPLTTKSYFPPQILISSCKAKATTPQHTTPSKEAHQQKHFLTKTCKAPVWRLNNYTSI